ncbi:MAG TPA: class I SAM-dependent methyltransferase [Candidatus Coproplasma stercoripullorum]|uniref:Class I SAM-dependent methyltransferase n=1 Tax=Candidatus Coproplasma stercoripullorum TaxID=2840751 RepID=A0A9D1DAS8_9FIRM|nr:class I SAM-dependent methyltransferase [Candidatus Coproplasma stercoripullorum]
MKFSHVDGGKEFDWGKTSQLYAKYRDIYPPEFLNRLCAAADIATGKNILDIGTGTGVIPRMLYGTGAYFTGIDIADNQIAEACRLAREGNMDINFICAPAENYSSEGHKFDSVIACQCFTYFDHAKLSVNLASAHANAAEVCA